MFNPKPKPRIKPELGKGRYRIYPPRLEHDLLRWGASWNTAGFPYGFLHVDHHSVAIDRLNMDHYLADPDTLIRELREAIKLSDEIAAGNADKVWWHVEHKPLTFTLYAGLLMPMNNSPWDRIEDSEAHHITIHARDFADDYKTIGVRHYIAWDEHQRLMRDKENSIETVIAKHVERGVNQGVANAIQKQTETLAETRKAKTEVRREMEALQRQLDKLNALEEKQAERERQKQERAQNRSTAGYVYFIQMTAGERLTRIGRSATPDVRLKYIPKLPFETTLEHLIQTDDMVQLERHFHDYYADKRVRGDWFQLSPDDIAYIKGLTP